jgi:serine/threonine-protein kinase 24/25/MST4
MHTIRPVKRFDSVSSNRASAEFIERRNSYGSMRSERSPVPSPPPPAAALTRDAQMGRTLVDEVVNPALEQVGFVLSFFRHFEGAFG